MRLRPFLPIVLSLFLFQCSSEEGPEANVDVDIIPSQPLALNSPITLNPGTDSEITYDPAVVSFAMRVKNDSSSEYHLAFVAMNVEYTNTVNGEKATDSFDAGEFDLEFLASAAPGDDIVLVDGASNIIRFYTGNLPVNEVGTIKYRIEIELLGWFTKVSKCGSDLTCDTTELLFTQSKRFNKKIYFSTL